jgi:hypothetical protein
MLRKRYNNPVEAACRIARRLRRLKDRSPIIKNPRPAGFMSAFMLIGPTTHVTTDEISQNQSLWEART